MKKNFVIIFFFSIFFSQLLPGELTPNNNPLRKVKHFIWNKNFMLTTGVILWLYFLRQTSKNKNEVSLINSNLITKKNETSNPFFKPKSHTNTVDNSKNIKNENNIINNASNNPDDSKSQENKIKNTDSNIHNTIPEMPDNVEVQNQEKNNSVSGNTDSTKKKEEEYQRNLQNTNNQLNTNIKIDSDNIVQKTTVLENNTNSVRENNTNSSTPTNNDDVQNIIGEEKNNSIVIAKTLNNNILSPEPRNLGTEHPGEDNSVLENKNATKEKNQENQTDLLKTSNHPTSNTEISSNNDSNAVNNLIRENSNDINKGPPKTRKKILGLNSSLFDHNEARNLLKKYANYTPLWVFGNHLWVFGNHQKDRENLNIMEILTDYLSIPGYIYTKDHEKILDLCGSAERWSHLLFDKLGCHHFLSCFFTGKIKQIITILNKIKENEVSDYYLYKLLSYEFNDYSSAQSEFSNKTFLEVVNQI